VYTKSAQYYDAIYEFRDYPATATAVTARVRERHSGAATLLDVACGTGRHLELWREEFEAEGLDLSHDLLATARQRCPDVPFHHADMTDFELGRRFDVVTCLFSSIAYVRTSENLHRAVGAMANHLSPGGLLLLEPWFTPETYWVNHLVANVVDRPDLKISWMYVSAVRDRMSVLDIHFQVGTPAGITQFRELHEMGLFTDDEYVSAFRGADLAPDYLRDRHFARGLFLGQKLV
jgi:SAM-dependent methyltransferase